MFAALEALYHRDKDSGLLITKTGHNRTGHNRTGHNKAGNKKRLTISDSEHCPGSLERRCLLYGSLLMFIAYVYRQEFDVDSRGEGSR